MNIAIWRGTMKTMDRIAGVVTTTVVAMGMLAACGTEDNDNADEAQTDDVSSTEAAEPSGTSAESGKEVSEMPGEDIDLRETIFPVEAQDAIDKATDEAGDGDVHAIELDYDSDQDSWVYSVKILTDGLDNENDDHKVKIDPVNGDVVDQETEQTSDTEKAIDLNDPMTYDEALDKATQDVEDALRGWKYEWDNGQYEYQFDFGSVDDTTEVTVNAESGEVTQD